MVEEKQKYRVVYAPRNPSILEQELVRSPTPKPDRITWGAQLSALHEVGYEIHKVRDEFIVMRLREESKYEGITNLADVKPYDVDEYLSKGWIVVDTWKDFVRMVKKK